MVGPVAKRWISFSSILFPARFPRITLPLSAPKSHATNDLVLTCLGETRSVLQALTYHISPVFKSTDFYSRRRRKCENFSILGRKPIGWRRSPPRRGRRDSARLNPGEMDPQMARPVRPKVPDLRTCPQLPWTATGRGPATQSPDLSPMGPGTCPQSGHRQPPWLADLSLIVVMILGRAPDLSPIAPGRRPICRGRPGWRTCP